MVHAGVHLPRNNERVFLLKLPSVIATGIVFFSLMVPLLSETSGVDCLFTGQPSCTLCLVERVNRIELTVNSR